MTRIHGLAVWTLALLAGPLGAQGNDNDQATGPSAILTTWPLRTLTGRVDPSPRLPIWSFLDLRNDVTRARLLGHEERRYVLEPDAIQSLLWNAVHQSIPIDDLVVDYLESGTLLVAGGGRDGRTILAAMQELELVFARGIVVEAELYDWSGRPLPPVSAKADELDALTEGMTPLWSGNTRTRSGAAVELGQHEVLRYVRSTEGEVAQNAKIGLPLVGEAFAGLGLTVVPHSLIASDDLVVMCQLAVSDVLEGAARHGKLNDQPTLDAPRLRIDAATMSGRIANGGALLYSVSSPAQSGNSFMLSVRCRYTTPRHDSFGAIRAWPVSALVSSALRELPFPTDDSEDSRAGVLRRHFDGNPTVLIDANKLIDLVRVMVEPYAWDDTAGIFEVNGWVVVRGSTNIVDAAEKLVLPLQARWLRTTSVELTSLLLRSSDDVPGPLARVAVDAEERVLHRIRIPMLADRSHVVVHGVESTAVLGIEAAVAQDTTLAKSVIQSVFSGVYAEVFPYRTGHGVAARLAVDLVQLSPERKQPLDTAYGGELDVTGTGIARFRFDGPLPPDTSHVMGWGPAVKLGGEVWRTRQAAQLDVK